MQEAARCSLLFCSTRKVSFLVEQKNMFLILIGSVSCGVWIVLENNGMVKERYRKNTAGKRRREK